MEFYIIVHQDKMLDCTYSGYSCKHWSPAKSSVDVVVT